MRSTGLGVLVTDIDVTQPWIPESGVRFAVNGVALDVFVLSGPDVVSNAIAAWSIPPSCSR